MALGLKVNKMATQTIVWIFNSIFLMKLVDAYYCNSDRCRENEYCCGDNICCVSYTVWELWYFWFGLVFFMILLLLCVCLWKTRIRDTYTRMLLGSPQPPYSPLSNKSQIPTSTNIYSDDFVTSVPDANDDLYYSRITSSSVNHQHIKTDSPPTYDEAMYGFSPGHKEHEHIK